MNWIVNQIAGAGNWLVSLSDPAKKRLVLLGLLGLGVGAGYKLVVSINRLSEPLPRASPEQLLKPMKKLYEHTSGQVENYQRDRQRDLYELDSMQKAYTTKRL